MALSPINSPWREQLACWCRDFERELGGHWDKLAAASLFSRIEQLSAAAQGGADGELAELATALTVYLCTFAEGDLVPGEVQRARLTELTGALAAASAQRENVAPAGESRRGGAAPRIFLVTPRGGARADLAAALGLLRCTVLPIQGIEAAVTSLGKERPDAVVVDAALLRELPALLEVSRRQATEDWRRVLWAAIGVEDDLPLRLFARRAGIDLLLDAAPADRVATILLAALMRRRDQRYRVLLVEDDPSQAAFASSLLRHQGLDVQVASTAAGALHLLGNRPPDLVLLDIHLPDMSGLDLAQLIRERDSLALVPLIFLTGEESEDVRDQAIAAGGDDFLSKPIRPRHLIANVNSRIERARALTRTALAEPIDERLSVRLDRVRFAEALEQSRHAAGPCLAVAAFAMDDVAAVTARLGFVRSGDLGVQLALAIETEAPVGASTCGVGEFSRLVLLEAETEHGLRRGIEDLRSRLESRKWLTAEFPLRVSFSVAAVRYDGAALAPDAIVAAALDELARLRSESTCRGISLRHLAPEPAADGDPLRRIARLMLSKPLPRGAARLQFRAFLPLRGSGSGHFLVRLVLVPPQSGAGLLIEPVVHAEAAAMLGVQATVDRLALQLVASYARSALVAARGWRVLLPVASVTLQEALADEWLQKSGVDAGQVVLLVDAASLSAGSSLAAALERLAAKGWHWALSVDRPDALQAGALALPNLDLVLTGNPANEPERWADVLAAAREYGKPVIATGIDEPRQVATLYAAGVHYAVGDVAGGWEDEPMYDAGGGSPG